MGESKTESLKDALKWLDTTTISDNDGAIIHLKCVYSEIFETLNSCVEDSLRLESE